MATLINMVGTDSVLRLKLKDLAELQPDSTWQRTTEITVRDVAPLAATRQQAISVVAIMVASAGYKLR